MKQKTFYFALLLLCLSAVNVFGQNDKKVFVMVHTEAGRDTSHPLINEILFDELGYTPDSLTTNSLYFQQIFWPSVVNMVQTADSLNIKLTLALQSQMAEYILQDTDKINIIDEWVQNGHELAIHHHGIGHVDWGGYTNRFQGTPYPDDYLYLDRYLNSGLYRGDMQQSFSYLQELAANVNENVITGCITDTAIDKPYGITNLTYGGSPVDLISEPQVHTIPGETLYWLSHCQLVSVYKDSNNVIIEDDSLNHQYAAERLDLIMSNLDQVDDNEVMGIVFHAFDYYRFPDIYRDLFIFLDHDDVNNKSVKDLMEEINTGIEDNTNGMVSANSQLLQNYPNPFNPSTTIDFSIQNNSKVELSIFNIKGQKIKTLVQDEFVKGNYSVIWNGNNDSGEPVSSGVYFYKLNVNGKTEATKKMLLLK